MQKIKFQPVFENSESLFEMPKPAFRNIPQWYRDTPRHTMGDTRDGMTKEEGLSNNLTVKGCSPFLDGLTAGYMFVTPCDIEVSLYEGSYMFKWRHTSTPLDAHSVDQAGKIKQLSSFNPFPLKWETGWRTITPRGYSTLFTHPLNRHDLPFRTFTGVVETDTWGLGTNFPFQFTEDAKDYFIIEKGTPICQAIPFKRDSWKHGYLEFDEKSSSSFYSNFTSKISRFYKENHWKKKYYS